MTISNFGPVQVVNTSATGLQYQVSAAGLASGKVLVTWYDDNLQTIRAQYYDALGNPIGGEVGVSQASPGSAVTELPRIAADPDGGFTIGYVGENPGVPNPIFNVGFIVADSDGNVSSGHATNFMAQGERGYMVAKPLAGSTVFAFEDDTVNSGDIIFGTDLSSTHTANITVGGQQTDPDIAVLAGGTRFVISWWDSGQAVKCRVFDSSLNALTSELVAGPVGSASGFGFRSGGHHSNAVAALNGGNFVVVWDSADVSAADTSSLGIQASVFDSNGAPVRLGFQVNTTTPLSQLEPSVVGLLDGGFAVAWADFSSLGHPTRLRTFDASGNPTSPEFTVDGAGHGDGGPHLALLADGRIAVTWEADTAVPQDSNGHVEMQIVDPRNTAVVLHANDVGADLVGTAFNDTFIDGLGNDRFTGHGGFDTVSFARAAGSIAVDLSLAGAHAVGGGMGIDTLTGIHGIVGSNFNDVLTGGAANDSLNGGPGSDRMTGGAGNDTYVVDRGGDVVSESGGAGVDTVRSSVTFSLVHSAHVIGNVEKLTLLGTGNFAGTGNSLANTLIGNVGANIEKGGSGKDVIIGGSGNDRLYGEVGNDTLTGGAGHDRFYFTTAPGAANIDHVTDFAHGVDKVYLENAIFKGLPAGGLAATAFCAGAHAADASDRIIYNRPTGALFFDSDGTGAHAQVEFAILNNKPALTAGDFVVI